jgi:hypothetical protein
MKALFAQKALYSSIPILPPAAFPAFLARGGAAGRQGIAYRFTLAPLGRGLIPTSRFQEIHREHSLRRMRCSIPDLPLAPSGIPLPELPRQWPQTKKSDRPEAPGSASIRD